MTTEMLWKRTDDVPNNVIRAFGSKPPSTLAREEVANRAMAVYRNDYGGLIDEALRAMFHDENYRNLRLHPHTSTNVLKRICEETCLVYQEPATRYLKTETDVSGSRATATGEVGELLNLSDEELAALPAQATPEESAPPASEPTTPLAAPKLPEVPEEMGAAVEPEKDPFDLLLEKTDLDSLFEECHQLGRILPALWIMPVVRADPTPDEPGHVRLDYDIYTPVNSGVDLDPKDLTQATAFWTWRDEPLPNGQTTRVRYKWGRDGSFTKWDEAGKQLPNDLAPDEKHPFGRLPVTAVRLGRPLDSYYLDGQGGDLYDATIEIALLRTLQNARYRDSSFKQLVIDGNPKDVPADQVMGNPAIPIYVNEGTAQVLDLQANLDALSAVVRERVEDIIVRYGVSPGQWSMSERAQSGFSKKMDQAKVNRINRKDRKWLAEAERDLYRLTAVVLGFYPVPEIGVLDADAEFVIDYAEPVYEEEPLTQARADALAVRLNRTNYLELLMRDNPDLTEREALQTLALNRLINQRFVGNGSQESTLMELLAAGAPKAPNGNAAPNGSPGLPQPPEPSPSRTEEPP